MVRRVLVTRPQPAAARTAERLAALGLAPLVLPLSETRSLSVDAPALPEDVAAVAVTSANAIRHAPRELIERLARLPCLAVGGKTAQAAANAGFADVIEGPGDADGLARTILERGTTGPIIYLCGRVRRDTFEQSLSKARVRTIPVETYDTRPLDPSPERLLEIAGGRPVDAVLLYSAEAGAAFAMLMQRADCAGLFEKARFCCLSERIAGTLDGRVRGKIRVASEPTEAALLSLIDTAD